MDELVSSPPPIQPEEKDTSPVIQPMFEEDALPSIAILQRSAFKKRSEGLKRTVGTYRAALIGSAPLIPVAATLITIALYIAIFQSIYSKLIATAVGFVLTLSFWLLIAMFFAPSTTAEGADVNSYNLLSYRLNRLETWINTLRNITPDESSMSIFEQITMGEIYNNLELASELLSKGGGSMAWVSGIGYVNMSRLVNRAEEALIMLEPFEAVIADGSRVEIILENTTISNKVYFHLILERALDFLSPGRLHQAEEPDVKKVQAVSSNYSDVQKVKPSSQELLRKLMEVRTTIREVTSSLNEFQDNQWEKLVRVRIQLRNLIALTGLVLLILLEFAILTALPLSTLISATFFFLIGAGVGLFSRLYEQAKVDSSIDDIRLAGVRLMAAPLFSGLAAIGGVAVMQKIAISSSTFSFDLTLFNILVAAAFGLAPNLFFNALQRQVDSVNKDKKA